MSDIEHSDARLPPGSVSPVLQDRLRVMSGCVTSTDPLVAFLYHLMRDHVPVGVVAAACQSVLCGNGERVYTNGFLARYAEWIARELRNNA